MPGRTLLDANADVHFKVCDQGEYWLLDDDSERVARWAGFYVPDEFLCHGDEGYGDYIIFKVGADGRIEGWAKPEISMALSAESTSGWILMENATLVATLPDETGTDRP